MRILIVKLSSFGDVVHTFPAATDLRTAHPDAEIDWLVEDAFVSIVGLHPAISEIHTVALRRLRWPPARWPDLVSRTMGLRARLRARRFDLVVDLQGLLKSAVVGRLASAPMVGYDRGGAREPAAAALYGRAIAVSKTMHAVQRSRCLMAAAVGYDMPTGPGDFGLTAPPRSQSGVDLPPRYAIAVHATSWPTKHWPNDHWRTLLSLLVEAGQTIILPWGSEPEKARADEFAAAVSGVHVLPHKLNGAELAAFVGGADYAVGLDSGVMHLAAALGVPGVWLYGPTDPGLTGPFADGQSAVSSDHPEAPCGRRVCDRQADGMCCMSAIAPVSVAAAVRALPVRSRAPGANASDRIPRD